MNLDEVTRQITALEPVQLKDLFARLARAFHERAEAVYMLAPQSNGPLAQPYADLGDACSDAGNVFDQRAQPAFDGDDALTARPMRTSSLPEGQLTVQGASRGFRR